MLSVNFCCRLTPPKKPSIVFLQKHHLIIQKNPNFSKILRNQRFPHWVSCLLHSVELNPQIQSQSVSNSLEEDSFVVTYLIESCGLSKEEAISASEKVKVINQETADSVLALFRKHEFSHSQISEIVRKRPLLLKAKVEKNLLPKIEFFQSVGITGLDLGKLISADPTLLTRSLNNQIIPRYSVLMNAIKSSKLVANSIIRSPQILLEDFSKSIGPNIEVLKEFGVPESSIIFLASSYPNSIMQKTDVFREAVIQVKKMGFDHEKSNFVLAVHALSGKQSKAEWDECFEAYRKWGLSNDDIMAIFKKAPLCMTSKEKINIMLDFLVNEMGWPMDLFKKTPRSLYFHFESRTRPRCSLVQFLFSKGLIKKLRSLESILNASDKDFWDRYVAKYVDKVPELLEVYGGKLDSLDR